MTPERPGDACDYHGAGVWERIAALMNRAVVRPSPRCGRVRCEPDWEWRPRLSDYDLWLAVRGRGTMRIGPASYPIAPGSLFVLRPGDSAWATQEPDDRLTVVYVHMDFYAPADAQPLAIDPALLPSRHIAYPDPSALDALLTRVVRLVESGRALDAVAARLALQQSLIGIYQQDAENQGAAGARIDRRIALVTTHVRAQPEARLTLEQAARLAGLAPGYFSRLFAREIGVSFREFVVRARLERARDLLEETVLPIGRIAEILGYDDLFLFSRQFRRRYGCAPRDVRAGAALDDSVQQFARSGYGRRSRGMVQ